MNIRIPITNLEIIELVTIIRKYPKGVVKVNNKEAIWETELDLNSNQLEKPIAQSGGNIFSNMADSITDSFNT